MLPTGTHAILPLPGAVDGSRVSLVVPSPRGGFEDQTRKTLPPGFPMQAIDVAFYEVHRDELLARCPGRWIVIYDGKLLGDWATFAEAYSAGIRLAKSEDIHVRQVVTKDQEPVISIPALALGIMGPVKYTPLAAID